MKILVNMKNLLIFKKAIEIKKQLTRFNINSEIEFFKK